MFNLVFSSPVTHAKNIRRCMKNEKTRKITKNNRIILTPLTLFMLNTTPLLCEVVKQFSVEFTRSRFHRGWNRLLVLCIKAVLADRTYFTSASARLRYCRRFTNTFSLRRINAWLVRPVDTFIQRTLGCDSRCVPPSAPTVSQ